MIHRRALLLSGLTASCLAPPRAWTLRYRIKLYGFAHDEGREALSAIEAKYQRSPHNMNRSFSTRVWGDATRLDWGARGTVFATFGGVAFQGGPSLWVNTEWGAVGSLLSPRPPSG